MNKEIAKRWVEELESGRWVQGTSRLGRGENRRCCLGVLQEIAPATILRASLEASAPSLEIRQWAGLNEGIWSLTHINDSDSSGTYAGPIAYIKEHFLGDES